jgi:hypothetical protein
MPELPELPELPEAAVVGASLDPMTVLAALAAAALAASVPVLLLGWPWRDPRSGRAAFACLLGAGIGLVVGCWRLGLRPRWPPLEDQDRLLLVLFPALLAVELTAACLDRFRWLAWLPRLVIAGTAARILLHESIYLAAADTGTRPWTPVQTWLILGGLAATLAASWVLLALLARRSPGRSVPLSVALACGGAGATVMLSGYASAGELGLALAAALIGVVIASLVLAAPPATDGLLGLGLVGLFALVVVGHFFGQLATNHAVLLFCAPLLCWLPELPFLRRTRPAYRGIARVVLTLVPVAVALVLAQQKYAADSVRTSPGSKLVQ